MSVGRIVLLGGWAPSILLRIIIPPLARWFSCSIPSLFLPSSLVGRRLFCRVARVCFPLIVSRLSRLVLVLKKYLIKIMGVLVWRNRLIVGFLICLDALELVQSLLKELKKG